MTAAYDMHLVLLYGRPLDENYRRYQYQVEVLPASVPPSLGISIIIEVHTCIFQVLMECTHGTRVFNIVLCKSQKPLTGAWRPK